jgi:hypothetical protein
MQAIADANPASVQIVRRDLICSNADADRTPIAGYLQSDNVHITPLGAYHIAADSGGLIEKLAAWVNPFTDFPVHPVTGDLCDNPTMTGTGGSVGTGCTGVAPDSMRFDRSTGSAITAVGSKETIGGEEYFKIVITRNGAGAATETIRLDNNGNITANLPAEGDWMRNACKVKWDASPAILSVHLQTREQPSSPANMTNYTMRTDTGLKWENVDIEADDGGGVWQVSPPWQWRAGGTSLIFSLFINVDNTSAGTDTLWISRMHLYPTDDPRPALGF